MNLDPYSDTWSFVSTWAEAQLKAAREQNDSTRLTDAQTHVLRGKIKVLKELLALPLPPKERRRAPPE